MIKLQTMINKPEIVHYMKPPLLIFQTYSIEEHRLVELDEKKFYFGAHLVFFLFFVSALRTAYLTAKTEPGF